MEYVPQSYILLVPELPFLCHLEKFSIYTQLLYPFWTRVIVYKLKIFLDDRERQVRN